MKQFRLIVAILLLAACVDPVKMHRSRPLARNLDRPILALVTKFILSDDEVHKTLARKLTIVFIKVRVLLKSTSK